MGSIYMEPYCTIALLNILKHKIEDFKSKLYYYFCYEQLSVLVSFRCLKFN